MPHEPARPYMSHVVDGKVVALPGTLAEIRAALPEEQREEFDREMYNTPLENLVARAIMGWATPQEDRDAAEAALERVRQGDLGGVRGADGEPGRPIT
ncbi:hypothetical protein [Embleya hyalina]|uniref:Uncharacterized protein n=1 Tax=Embleya hyalina TaxID=516124 RepID=A0A401Z211_9ACTN|nr:hypothetical protein [Embleya hyalina]GCE00910.1 hypothetical protein EHYA_08637 [Embleya hyalina]